MIRLKEGKYLIGTEKKLVMSQSNGILVKVGGGWEKLQSYVGRV